MLKRSSCALISVIKVVLLLLICLSGVAEGRQRCDAPLIKLSDVMSYTLWFQRNGADDLTIPYASEIIEGRFKPRKNIDYWEFSLPLDWSADPYHDDSWQFQLHSLYMLDPLLAAEEATGDEKYVRAALRILADWHSYHVVRNKAGKFSWYNMAVGTRSAKIAYLHNLICRNYPDLMDEDTGQMFLDLAESHVSRVIDGTIPLRMTNHGLFQIHGLMAMCREFDYVEACRDHRAFASRSLAKIIHAQFDDEGMHLEHSPGYHGFALGKLNRLIRTGWYEGLVDISDVVRKASENLFWLVDPSLRFWGVGDTNASNVVNVRMAGTGSELCDSSGLSRVVSEIELCTVLRQFSAGYVAIRSTSQVPVKHASGLFYQGAFHSSVHKHLDDQSFELFENGERVIVDSGYFNYQAHPMRRFMLSTRAHNTVEIGGKSFSRDKKHAYGSAIQRAGRVDDYFIVQGRVVHDELKAIHSRQLLYKPGSWLFVRDWVTGNPGRKVIQWFHLNPKAVLGERAEYEVSFTLSDTEYRFRSLSGCRVLVKKGAKKPRLQGWYSPRQGESLPNYAVGFECKESDSPLQVAITFSPKASIDLDSRLQALQRRNPFR